MNPLVSIVIPCYKGERYLSESIESCLKQSYENLEIIVVDDVSPDKCAEIADRFAARDARVRVLRRETNGGVSRAFNTGFNAAKGEFFTRLAQDDLFREDAIEIMAKKLIENPKLGLVYCDYQRIDSTGKILGRQKTPTAQSDFFDDATIGLCVMWRHDIWLKVGEFNPEFDAAEDYDYWCRISQRYPIARCSDEAPFFFRIHESMGSVVSVTKQEIVGAQIYARYCGSRVKGRKKLARAHYSAGYIQGEAGNFKDAFYHLKLSARYSPFDVRPYWTMLKLALRSQSAKPKR